MAPCFDTLRVAQISAGVFLHRRNPGHLHGRALDPLPQGGNALDAPQKGAGDAEMRLVTHALPSLDKSSVSQVSVKLTKAPPGRGDCLGQGERAHLRPALVEVSSRG